MIAVIDYGMGNLQSVAKALEFLGARVKLCSSPKDLENASKIVLPGVGAFGDAVRELKRRGLYTCLREKLENEDIYFLGICLGLQLLFERSEESKGVKGLGVFKGTCKIFPKRVKIPQIGWNSVKTMDEGPFDYAQGRRGTRDERCPLLKGIPSGSHFYFCHSYYVAPQDKNIIAATSNYGKDFTAVIQQGNIFGVQFHPEKSQALGLKVLTNFINI
ncbi:MAG: imidazole glycerol phosphate synthase subunit HisH [Candidatus Omnitrophota bacterium]